MEYVSGHDLRALWDRTRDSGKDGKTTLPIGIACFIVKKICDGLDYAHRRRDAKGRPLGIIHRDVSPQNILISYDGDLKIIDFGIAKAANRIVRTQTGILKGKFAYMAPEQARGEPTDHRADIFAIGVILSRRSGASTWCRCVSCARMSPGTSSASSPRRSPRKRRIATRGPAPSAATSTAS